MSNGEIIDRVDTGGMFMYCSISPTADFIAVSFGVGRNMTVIDRRTRQPAADFKSSGYAVFSPNGKYLAVACVPDSVIEIRETKEWSLLSTLLCEVPQAAMTFSADSTYFASGGRSGGGIQVWQTSNFSWPGFCCNQLTVGVGIHRRGK